MPEGIVKWFNKVKGFGFIEMGNGQDIFVHYKDVMAEPKILEQGQKVTLLTKESARGLRAVNVCIVHTSSVKVKLPPLKRNKSRKPKSKKAKPVLAKAKKPKGKKKRSQKAKKSTSYNRSIVRVSLWSG